MKTAIKIQFNGQIIELNRKTNRDRHLIFPYLETGQEYEIGFPNVTT